MGGKYNKYFLKNIISVMMALVLIAGIIPFKAEAGEDDTAKSLVFKKLEVSVMPEYDDPRVLIVNEGTLVNKSSKPLTGVVSLNIPKNAEIGMACELVNGGQHSCQPFNIEANGEYDRLSWRITKTLQPGEEYPVFWEYYYTPAQGFTAPDKSFDVGITSNYPLNQITYTIVQPLKATNVKLNPAVPLIGKSSEGMNLYSTTYSNKLAGEKVPLTLAYTKTDPNPSKEKPQEPNSPPPLGGAGSQSTFASLATPKVIFPSILLILGLMILTMYVINQRKNATLSTKVKKPAKVYQNDLNNTKDQERKKARKMLLDGKISEETYQEILADLED